ncbi:MAG: hypothetical protein GF388_00920, partial [Candidatus Aegiribacteria sp.]|nr:hypothetical protein [Candidatus Aegiribacteria sp.]
MPLATETQKKLAYLGNKYPQLYNALTEHRTHKGDAITFRDHRYLKKIYMDSPRKLVVKKSTQCGISEFLVVVAIAKAREGRSIFYVLPTYFLMTRFVKNRFDKSILQTPGYQQDMHETKQKRIGLGYMGLSESMTLKSFHNGTIAFLGSQSTGAFTEFPADDVIIDELDECDQENIQMSEERLAHSDDPRQIYVGNPTLTGYGIDEQYSSTDKQVWAIRCECGKYVMLDFFKNIVSQDKEGDYVILDPDYDEKKEADIRPICHHCNRPIDRYGDGAWIPTGTGKYPGYHISKLFST